ncbi:phosphopantetheine adenylyltransferase [Pseudomarimonas arenosa]|uniref:Phosphopantetheine adenylyltransferase n=1 Tax=Pseudomarimonas arenosa TaxID=2774145 RepID=A0AAW3ZNP1_9GAMM|nr:phosphopantetheine adenylyltransferase [Pseudomarimonas arenosa]MBD8527348.1 phosphopantetheine adenylyltransferase [Pseudomarimonas arenosa]
MNIAPWLVRLGLLVAALIHLAPLAAVAGASMLSRMYGVVTEDPSLLLLLQHRALLFGLLGSLSLAAMWRVELRSPALLAALVSMSGFLLLGAESMSSSALNAEVNRVWWVDLIALPCVLSGAVAQLWSRRRGRG